MANVAFKRGLQTQLKNASIQDGAFYITTDTNRMYWGNGPDVDKWLEITISDSDAFIAQQSNHGSLYIRTGTPDNYTYTEVNNYNASNTLYFYHPTALIELNKGITIVDRVADLPTTGVEVGQFYYIKGPDTTADNHQGNILAVCTYANPTSGQATWTQVNPDHNDNDHLSSISGPVFPTRIDKDNNTTNIVSDENDADAPYIPQTLTFQMVDKAGTNTNQHTATIKLRAKDILALAEVKVTTDQNETNTVTVTSTTGGSFKIKGGQNVSLNKDDNDASMVLIDTGVSPGSILNTVVYNNNKNTATQNISVNGQTNSNNALIIGANGGLKMTDGVIGHAHEITGGAGNGSAAETAITLTKDNNSFTAVTNVTYDAYGHITSETYNTITLPTWKAHSLTAGTGAQDAGKLIFAIGDQTGGATKSFKSGQILYNTLTVDGNLTTKYNTEDLGSFYSASAIDAKLRTLDALTYKGIVASSADIPDGADATSNDHLGVDQRVQIGDTYKVSATDSDIIINGVRAKLGDLIIATGTEDDGYITTGTLNWTLVAGGTDTDTTYKTKVMAGVTDAEHPENNHDAKLGIISNTANGDFTQFVKLKSDAWVDITPTAGEDAGILTFAHATPTAAESDPSFGDNGSSVAAGGSIKVPKIKKDSKGHITSIEDVSISIPGAMKLDGDTSTDTMYLKDAAGNAQYGKLKFAGDAWITADLTVDATDNKKFTTTISHNVPANFKADGYTDTSTDDTKNLQSATPADRSFAAVTSITRDAKGHVTNYNIETVTLGQVAYTLNKSVNNNIATITLNDQGGQSKGAVAISSGTIQFTTTQNGFSADIVWGTF